MITLLIHMDAKVSIILCRGFSEKNIISLLSYHLRQTFDELYRGRILGRDMLDSSTVNKTAVIQWDKLQSHEVMAELSEHDIKGHTFITSTFVEFLIKYNVY